MKPEPLWLALHLPYLAIEAGASLPSSDLPSAIVERGRVLVCNKAAARFGVEPDMGASVARMLSPSIRLMARDPAREAAARYELACWAGRFSPRINLRPDTLLLEIGSCLRLFGGFRALVNMLGQAVGELDYTVTAAAAPTPLATEWLAQCGAGGQGAALDLPENFHLTACCLDHHRMMRALDRLPVGVLAPKAAALLQGFGARTLLDVRRLPSADLSRRIGADALRQLAQAYGESADLREDFVFPEHFSLSLQLPGVVENAPGLLFAARRLIAALSGWLSARQSGIHACTLNLIHEKSDTPLMLRFADQTADAARFERVLRERLERHKLTEPVEALRLTAHELAPLPGENRPLFDAVHQNPEALLGLLERLSARIGEQCVFRCSPVSDHRPECASRQISLKADMSSVQMTRHPRPLWLLDPPESLSEINGRPCRRGALELLAGPERLESGWWENGEAGRDNRPTSPGDLRRDYFVALSPDGHWLWIYRECREPAGWFLHGYFS